MVYGPSSGEVSNTHANGFLRDEVQGVSSAKRSQLGQIKAFSKALSGLSRRESKDGQTGTSVTLI